VLPSSPATAQGQPATNRVIIVLKNQATNLPANRTNESARKGAIQNAQAPVVSQLAASGARNVHSYTVLNAISATVSRSEISQLKSDPAVSKVVPDQIIHLAPAQPAGSSTAGTAVSPLPGACAPPGKVQLNPQALETIHADSQNPLERTARSLGVTGKGVTVAFIADGLDTNNADFIRADGSHVFVDYKDFSGEGTSVATGGGEAFLDASSIAAQGRHVYDVSHYSQLPLNRPCNIRIEGVAPGASLVGLTIFGAEDAGFNSSFLQAIDYAVSVDHVQVLNESLGSNFYPDDKASLDLIKQANDLAEAAGTTVTVSSGDAGITSTTGTPSTDPKVISAGASTTYRIDAQDGYGGARFPGVSGWLNNNISSFSSGGFQQDGRTIDVVAPGELNWALCSTNTAQYFECTNYAGNPSPVQQTGGTSESAPLTAGVAALVIEAYRNTHGGDSPTPAVVKQIITSTANDVGSPADQQGAGLVDAYKAVLAAESYRAPASAPTPAGNTLLTSAGQLNAIDAPGRSETLTDTVTNNGARTQTISVSGRALGAYQQLKTATVTLSDSSSPHISDWQGITDNYQPITFNVPQGQNRLNASIAFQNASATDLAARVRLTLVDPLGELAAYSVPQGDGNFGNVQVTNPVPGKWTAYVYSRNSSAGGTTGPVVFGASVATYKPFGTVSPATLTLGPGQSGTVTLQVSMPSQPGDTSGAIVLSTNRGPGGTTTIPVTLRSLIPNGPSTFTGTLTGGNGRAINTGQEFYYQLNLPAGRPELNASIKLANNPNNPFDAWLVSPTGEALAFSANDLPSPNPPGYTSELGAQLHVLSPAQGAWTLIVAFVPQVSGTALSEPFTVTTDQTPVRAQAPGLPSSAHTQLLAGQAHTYKVRIHNGGSAPEAYFIDARLPTSTTLNLSSLSNASTTEPLNFTSNIPIYLLPTHTTSFFELAGTPGTQPIQFDSSSPAGDPDIASSAGTAVSASFAANPISQGLWSIVPVEVGPFGATGGPTETVTTAMSATSNAFDSSVSSPTGDLWQASTDPAALGNFAPVVVAPGQTATIPVTITPTGPSGTPVSGTLYVDDANFVLFRVFQQPNGNEVAAIPYSYTIK
jgi:hypothetical protein